MRNERGKNKKASNKLVVVTNREPKKIQKNKYNISMDLNFLALKLIQPLSYLGPNFSYWDINLYLPKYQQLRNQKITKKKIQICINNKNLIYIQLIDAQLFIAQLNSA